ncbi:MAG: AAA family ATPase [Gammaproteobacteria bacterium]|nr:AAA family ATPase [Gammaproteobacteria bacterium]MBU1655452.1 AAA family ATPase [Gammaproteobacteria bacterium]MBU1962419.1 AAA family ATPase [Gammaproteobacteria bacterium]
MYQEFFGFTDAPFRLTPDTDFYYPNPSHQEALNLLRVALNMGEGFIKILGEVGSGKTLLCRKLLHLLGENFFVAYIPNPYMNASALRHALATELGIDSDEDMGQHRLMQRIHERLIELAASGRQAVLILDEAQALPPEGLEAIRLFTNLETEKRKLLQVVLFGQPELDANLGLHGARQLLQRISFAFQLKTLDREGVKGYIQHRLRAAGAGEGLFEPAAIKQLYRATKGTPRLINIIAHKSLLAAYGKGSRVVKRPHVVSAIKDSAGTVGTSALGFWRRMAGLSASAMAATGAWYLFGPGT